MYIISIFFLQSISYTF